MTGEVWDTPTLEQHLIQTGEKLSDDLRGLLFLLA